MLTGNPYKTQCTFITLLKSKPRIQWWLIGILKLNLWLLLEYDSVALSLFWWELMYTLLCLYSSLWKLCMLRSYLLRLMSNREIFFFKWVTSCKTCGGFFLLFECFYEGSPHIQSQSVTLLHVFSISLTHRNTHIKRFKKKKRKLNSNVFKNGSAVSLGKKTFH